MSTLLLFANVGGDALSLSQVMGVILGGALIVLFLLLLIAWLTVRYIPNQRVGVVEKLWSGSGSVPEGRIIALKGEAGYQADLLRGGLHFALWRWQYRVHKLPLVTIPQGKIGYIYARDGEPLPPSQTLGRVVECNHFQDARAFLGEASDGNGANVRGQRGRQRAILREGVYAINPAAFVVITEDAIYRLRNRFDFQENAKFAAWHQQLKQINGFNPVVVGVVLIGKPDTAEAGGKIETLLEQLRIRQLSIEQLETYERQRASAEKLRMLNEAQAQAAMQTQLTNSRVQIQIAESQGEADLARARKQAEQTVVNAEAELARARRQAEQTVVLAEAEGRQRILAGRGEAQRVMQIGLSEASVLMRKIASFGDPRLYALSLITEHLTHSSQPLVPERVFMSGAQGAGAGNTGVSGLLGLLLNLLVAEKSGFQPVDSGEMSGLKEISERLTRDALESLHQASLAPANGPAKT